MRILQGRPFNAGDKKPMATEERMEDVKFNVFKFNDRPKPTDKRQIIVITNFSEFGCESIALMYCLPRVMKMYPGAYFVAVGWYGREYLYRHLVDEFWEIKEEHQWLREYSRAFTNESKNLAKIEKALAGFGQVLSGAYFGHICLGNTCRSCKHFWGEDGRVEVCAKCGGSDIERSLFGDIPNRRQEAVEVPRPKWAVVEQLKKDHPDLIRPNMVGIFARGRACYGRNLPPEFYTKLIRHLRLMNYEPIWLGEKQSVQPCPDPTVSDWSRMPESRDLEKTLAIISRCEFTIQFWTASTRLASMVGTPWILFESPDQIVGRGQEGMRIALTTEENKKKLVLAHYLNVLDDHDGTIKLVDRAVKEIHKNNWKDIVGMVENAEIVESMLTKRQQWGVA